MTLSGRTLFVAVAVLAALGAGDAAATTAWDLLAVDVMIAAVALVGIGRGSFGRRPMTLRADLARWLDDRAAVGAEATEQVLDRAVAACRAGFVDDPGAPRERATGPCGAPHGPEPGREAHGHSVHK